MFANKKGLSQPEIEAEMWLCFFSQLKSMEAEVEPLKKCNVCV